MDWNLMLLIDWEKVDLSSKVQKEFHSCPLLLLEAKENPLLESVEQSSVEFLVWLIFNVDNVQ